MGSARGGFDNSALGERGVLGIFFDALEGAFERSWSSRVGVRIDADSEVMTHRFLGHVPAFREWIGGIQVKGLNDYEILVRMKDFEAAVGISLHDLRRDKTGHLTRRLGELAEGANINHWEELLVALISANPTAYDGVAFFSAAHVHGESGTLKNLLTSTEVAQLDVATATNPTKDEAIAILGGLVGYASKMKDDQGRFYNKSAREWLLLVPTNLYAAFAAAARQMQVATGGPNPLNALEDKFTVVKEPGLDAQSTSVIYLFRIDGLGARPFILQEEVAPHLDILDENSDYAKLNNKALYIAKATRNVAPGEFKHAFKATLS